jgi:hypothetical protein
VARCSCLTNRQNRALRQLAVDLAPIRDDLRASAEASGWEVE